MRLSAASSAAGDCLRHCAERLRAALPEIERSRPVILVAAGACVALAAAIVTIGWGLRSTRIIRVLPDAPPMQLDAALGLVCIGSGLTLIGLGRVRAAWWALAIAIAVGLFALWESLAGIDAHVDRLVGREGLASGVGGGAIMAPSTAVSFILLGIACTVLYRERPLIPAGATLATLVVVQAASVLLFFMLGVDAARRPSLYTGMALHTAGSLVLAGGAVLAGRRLLVGTRDDQWFPIAVAVGILGVTLVLWWGLRAQEAITLQRFVRRQSDSIGSAIHDELEHQARSMLSMRWRWQRQGGLSLAERAAEAEEYLRSWPGARRIEWLDPQGNVRWVFPADSPAGLPSPRLRLGSALAAALAAAERSHGVASGSAQPFPDGSRGYSLVTALSSGRKVAGYIRVVWRAADVFRPIVRRHLEMGYAARVEESGHVLFGSGGPTAPGSRVTHRLVDGYGLQWMLLAGATPRGAAELRSPLPDATLIGGALLSLLMGGAIQLLLVARRQRTEILAAERRFQLLVEGVRDYAIYMLDAAGRIVTWNQGAERIEGWRAEDVVGRHFSKLFLEEDVQAGRPERLLASAACGNQVSEEWWRRRKDGNSFWAGVLITALRDSRGQLVGYSEVTRDLTERKRNDERIRDALREKEILLKEVYHRVKNNLQVIHSLVNLQRRVMPAGLARDALEDTVQRVRAMALVHEKLYQSRDLAVISAPDYVRDLCRQLTSALIGTGRRISATLEIDPIELGLDVAVPLGLLLTELVSNSIKHAFPDGRAGQITLRLKRDREGAILTVADDGIGLPPGFDLHSVASLGLTLAGSLAVQMGGALRAASNGGATFSLEIPEL